MRQVREIIEAYQMGEALTDEEVERALAALQRLREAVLEVGNDVSLVIPWLMPKLCNFEEFHKTRQALKVAKEKDEEQNWGEWLFRFKHAPMPYQTWTPFPPDTYVEVAFESGPNAQTEKGLVSDFWWGYERDSEDGVIRRCRKWVG